MKILHTSDWHLGKNLDKYSRIEEQKKFIEELEKICDTEKIDLIIIAGDIYDTVTPPIFAEKLFFKAMKRLSKNGERPIIIIAGNHDSPSKIISSSPLASEFGIILTGSLQDIIEVKDYDNFKIIKSGEGFFEIELKGEKAVFITLPYPTEKTINSIIFDKIGEDEMQKSFSEKIKEILDNLATNFREDTINIVVSHLFAIGGKECDSERNIQLIGGTYAINPKIFPQNADYVALGHLHKKQKVSSNPPAYYSGSPIRYSLSEINYDKNVLIIDVKAGTNSIIKEVKLTDYKPMYLFKCNGYEEALERANETCGTDSYAFFEIISKNSLTGQEIKTLKEIKKDIVSISISFDETEEVIQDKQEEKTILEEFRSFYKHKKQLEATDEMLNMFIEILQEIEEEEKDEAYNT